MCTCTTQYAGRYDWDLAARVRAAANKTVYSTGRPVARVLALSPALDLARTRNWTELNLILYSLIQVCRGSTHFCMNNILQRLG